jgi:3-oxoacyl-[acyl-carrier protein] reductase
MTNLTGKVALITGSARGIGRAIAERYASLGAAVAVNHASSEADALQVAAAIEAKGGRAIAIQADASQAAELGRLFTETIRRLGQIDIVVANAGLELIETPIGDVTEANFDRLFAINAKGTYFTLQLAARHVTDTGRIIYIGSSTTRYPLPGYTPYGASKLGAQFVVESLAKEIGSRGVTVNTILPTVTDGAGVFTHGASDQVREFVREFRAMARMGTAEDVADAAEYLASDLASFVSGQHLLLSGGAPA